MHVKWVAPPITAPLLGMSTFLLVYTSIFKMVPRKTHPHRIPIRTWGDAPKA